MIANHKAGFNAEFMDELEAEIPHADLDGDAILASRNFLFKVAKNKPVDEGMIAERRQ